MSHQAGLTKTPRYIVNGKEFWEFKAFYDKWLNRIGLHQQAHPWASFREVDDNTHKKKREKTEVDSKIKPF